MILGAFPRGDAETIQEMLHKYLWDSISVRDTAVRMDRKENFYHGMVLGLLQSQDSWLLQSNAENGEGYSDISICTPERTGIVIEMKYAEDGNLKTACEKDLKQIEEKKICRRASAQEHEKNHKVRYGILQKGIYGDSQSFFFRNKFCGVNLEICRIRLPLHLLK